MECRIGFVKAWRSLLRLLKFIRKKESTGNLKIFESAMKFKKKKKHLLDIFFSFFLSYEPIYNTKLVLVV